MWPPFNFSDLITLLKRQNNFSILSKKTHVADLEFLYNLAVENKGSVIETGTFKGISAAVLAAAVYPNTVWTCELTESNYRDAEKLWKDCGVSNIVLLKGDSIKSLESYEFKNVTFGHVDGHHSYTYSFKEFSLIRNVMKAGIILVDDIHYVHPEAGVDGGVPKTVKTLENMGFDVTPEKRHYAVVKVRENDRFF